MDKYTQKPMEIYAVQWRGDNLDKIREYLDHYNMPSADVEIHDDETLGINISSGGYWMNKTEWLYCDLNNPDLGHRITDDKTWNKLYEKVEKPNLIVEAMYKASEHGAKLKGIDKK